MEAFGCWCTDAALTYNVFALTTLLHVGQLGPVSQEVAQHEQEVVCKMLPGPGSWFLGTTLKMQG